MCLARRLSLFLLLIYSATTILVAQGRWRTFLSYGATVAVAETPTELYALSQEGTLLAFPKDAPEAARTYAREDGLSEAHVAAIAYAPEAGTLLLYYPSGRIDLKRGETITPLTDLARSSRIRDYRLRAVAYAGDRAWLAGAFGLVELDLVRGALLRSAFVGDSCEGVAYQEDGGLVVLRAGQLYRASAEAGSWSPSRWSPLALPSSFPTTGWQALAADGGGLWLLDGQGRLYRLLTAGEGSALVLDGREAGWERLTPTGAGVVVTRGDRSLLCQPDGSSQPLPGRYALSFASLSPHSLWGAAQGEGLRHYLRSPSGAWTNEDLPLTLDTPRGDVHFTLRAEGGYLYSVGGGRNYDRYGTPGLVQCFDGTRWQAWTESSLRHPYFPSLYDPVDVLPVGDGDPTHLYVASWGDGLFELQGGAVRQHYGTHNSPLHAIPPTTSGQVRVGSLARDGAGMLFLAQGMSGSATGTPVRSLSRSGQWRAYDYPEERDVNAFGQLAILPRGTKWLAEHSLLSASPGVLVFHDLGTASAEDDYHARYTSLVEPSGKVFSPGRITALKVDRASRLWIGMDIGYGQVLRPEELPQAGKLPVVDRPVGGTEPPYYYLLAGLTVTAIEVDALDRKWLGTASDGLYLLRADGRQVLAHYTRENSPLVSDAITALAFDERSGQLFIGSTSGLSVLATEAGAEQASSTPDAYAFPNPLRPEDPAGITFRDLPAGAHIRITDAAGRLCALLESPLTELFWDTLSADGVLLPAGIYLATIYPPAGGTPQQIKLALLRP